MACLRGSVPCFTTMVVLHDGRASYICILLVIQFLIKLTCVVLRNRLSNVARDSRKCQASAHFLHSSAPEHSEVHILSAATPPPRLVYRYLVSFFSLILTDCS